MPPFFKRKEKEGVVERQVNDRIEEILKVEEVIKQEDFNDGTLVMTEKFLLWKNKGKKVKSCIIPLESIEKVEKATKMGLGGCLKIVYSLEGQYRESFFPLMRGFLDMSITDTQENWVRSVNSKENIEFFKNITYTGGHASCAEKKTGKITVTSVYLVFESDKGDFKLEIPLEKVKNISVKNLSEISRLSTVLVGPLWSIGLPSKSKLVIIESEDEIGMSQMPLFDFPFDTGDKKKSRLMRVVYERIKKIKANS